MGQMEDVYRSNRPWLVPGQRRRVEDVLAVLRVVEALLVSTRGMEATMGLPADAASLAETLRTFDVGTPINMLDDEVTRLASSPSVLERLWDGFLDWLVRAGRPNRRDTD